MRLDHLPARDQHGHLRIVVECPRGSTVKLKYEPALNAFKVKRALPQGLAYPFDWGFIPGTLGDDGDPIDALVVHGTGTYPGVVMDCRPLGMVDVTQKKNQGRISNPRLIVIPTWYKLPDGDLNELSPQFKQEVANFFATAGYFAGSEPLIEGWRSAEEANALIRSAVEKLKST